MGEHYPKRNDHGWNRNILVWSNIAITYVSVLCILNLTLLSPSYFRSPRPKGGGGGIVPLENLYMFGPIAMKFGKDVK